MRYLTRGAIALAAGILLLAGCTSSGTTAPGGDSAATGSAATSAPASSGSSSQSAAEACAALGTALSDASSTVSDAMKDAGSDPAKAAKALDAFKDSFAAAVATLGNAEVKAQAQKAVDALAKAVPLFEAGAKDTSKLADAMIALTEFQKELSGIASVCTG